MRRRRGPFRRRGHRRPPFGRPGRRAFPHGPRGGAISGRVQKELRRANRLTEQGDHINAAALFERLAKEAYDRNILRQAPMLFLQAAHAYVLAGEVEKGVDQAQKGLNILVENQRWHKLRTVGGRVIETLSRTGYTAEAVQFQTWLDDTLESHEDPPSPKDQPRGQLPPKCPYCGATVRSDEVSWIDKNSAECPYCGSAVPTSK